MSSKHKIGEDAIPHFVTFRPCWCSRKKADAFVGVVRKDKQGWHHQQNGLRESHNNNDKKCKQ